MSKCALRVLTIISLVVLLGVLMAAPVLRAAPGDIWVTWVTPFPNGGVLVGIFLEGDITPTPTPFPTATNTPLPTVTATPTITPTPTPGGSWIIVCPDAPFLSQVPNADGSVSIMIDCPN